MRRSSAVLLIVCTVCTVGLCAHSYGAVVVAEYNGYERGVDYRVDGMSQIVILKPSDPELGPYDFDCYDDSTEPPYDPATIQAITAVAGIGDVEIMVRGHEGREYGASNVLLLQLNQDGVNSSVKELKIQYDLGADGRVAHPSCSEGWGRDSFARSDRASAMCGGRH
jgi:hypothetical protein